MANLFIHFEPLDAPQQVFGRNSTKMNIIDGENVKAPINLPKYILADSLEAERLRNRPNNVSICPRREVYSYQQLLNLMDPLFVKLL